MEEEPEKVEQTQPKQDIQQDDDDESTEYIAPLKPKLHGSNTKWESYS